MNCQSCGALLPMGAIRCYRCGTARASSNNTQRSSLRQFIPSPVASTSPTTPTSPASPSLPISRPVEATQHIWSPPIQSIERTQSISQETRAPRNYIDAAREPGKETGQKRIRIAPLIVISVLVLLGLTLTLAGGYGVHQELVKFNTTATVVAQQLENPTGKTISSVAAAILFHAQTADAVDTTLAPTHLTSTFTTGQRVYVTFHINSRGQDGEIEVRWYSDGQQVTMSMFHHTATNMLGLVSTVYTMPANVGVAALFWCRQPDCGDAQLAFVLSFTVRVGNNPVVERRVTHASSPVIARSCCLNEETTQYLAYHILWKFGAKLYLSRHFITIEPLPTKSK